MADPVSIRKNSGLVQSLVRKIIGNNSAHWKEGVLFPLDLTSFLNFFGTVLGCRFCHDCDCGIDHGFEICHNETLVSLVMMICVVNLTEFDLANVVGRT